MTVAVIIVAAGRGLRLGAVLPKQYLPLGNSTPICLAIEAFLTVDAVRWVLPVIHPADRALCTAALSTIDDARLCTPVEGGATRAASVRKGLESLRDKAPERVLIHDAARPFVTEAIIRDVIAALDTHDGACAALPVVDALWSAEGSCADRSVPRDRLWRAQTPQGFRFDRILEAHEGHDGTGADDVAVAREAGMKVQLIQGSERNYKITTQSDMQRAYQDLFRAGTDGAVPLSS